MISGINHMIIDQGMTEVHLRHAKDNLKAMVHIRRCTEGRHIRACTSPYPYLKLVSCRFHSIYCPVYYELKGHNRIVHGVLQAGSQTINLLPMASIDGWVQNTYNTNSSYICEQKL